MLSLGSATPLHRICYYILPGFNTFRHPGNIRLFTSIGIILLAAVFIQQFIHEKKYSRQKLISTLYILAGILLLPVVYSLFLQRGILSNITNAIRTKQPKAFLDELRFPSMLLIQAVLQLGFTAIMILLMRKKHTNQRMVAILMAANSILFCWIALPFNFISQVRTKAVNEYVASFPDGYPLPDINGSVGPEIISDSTKFPVYGYPNFYSKKITIQDYVITPTLNKDYEKFNNDKKLRVMMAGYPMAWLNDTVFDHRPDSMIGNKKFSIYEVYDYQASSGRTLLTSSAPGSIKLTGFNPNQFRFVVNASQRRIMSLFQQYNENWKLKVNGKQQEIFKLNYAFMGCMVPAGTTELVFSYRPARVITTAWISVFAIVTILIYFIFFFIRNRNPV